MFDKIKKLIFNKKKGLISYEDDEYYDFEEIELPTGDIAYRESSKILIVSKKKFIFNKDNMDWFRGIIELDKAKTYLEYTPIDKDDLVEVIYKESMRNEEVINREIKSIKKLEGISYNIKTDISKVKKVYDLGFAEKGIEFDNGHTYSETQLLHIGPSLVEEEEINIYRRAFMYEGDLCNETYLEILKDGINTGSTITIEAEKIRDDHPIHKFPWLKDL